MAEQNEKKYFVRSVKFNEAEQEKINQILSETNLAREIKNFSKPTRAGKASQKNAKNPTSSTDQRIKTRPGRSNQAHRKQSQSNNAPYKRKQARGSINHCLKRDRRNKSAFRASKGIICL